MDSSAVSLGCFKSRLFAWTSASWTMGDDSVGQKDFEQNTTNLFLGTSFAFVPILGRKRSALRDVSELFRQYVEDGLPQTEDAPDHP